MSIIHQLWALLPLGPRQLPLATLLQKWEVLWEVLLQQLNVLSWKWHISLLHTTLWSELVMWPHLELEAQSCPMTGRGEKLEHLINSTNNHQNKTLFLSIASNQAETYVTPSSLSPAPGNTNVISHPVIEGERLCEGALWLSHLYTFLLHF